MENKIIETERKGVFVSTSDEGTSFFCYADGIPISADGFNHIDIRSGALNPLYYPDGTPMSDEIRKTRHFKEGDRRYEPIMQGHTKEEIESYYADEDGDDIWGQIDLGMNVMEATGYDFRGNKISVITDIVCPSPEQSLLYDIKQYIEEINEMRELHKECPEEEEAVTPLQELILTYAASFKVVIENAIEVCKNRTDVNS